MLKVKFETVVSLTAMATAVIAVFVAIMQTRLMGREADLTRQHQRLSVMPSLLIDHSYQQKEEIDFTFRVSNQGLGPAVVEDFTVRYRGATMANWHQIMEAVTEGANGDKTIPSIRTGLPHGRIIPADKSVQLIEMKNLLELSERLDKVAKEIEIEICYCSLYQECWRATAQQARPVAVEACSTSPDYFDSATFNRE